MKFCAENCCLSWKNINLIRLLIRSFYFGNGSYRWFGLPRLPESQQRHQKAIVLDQKRESREFEGQFLFCCLDSGAKSDVSKIEIFRVHFWAFRRLECIEMDRKLHFSSPAAWPTPIIDRIHFRSKTNGWLIMISQLRQQSSTQNFIDDASSEIASEHQNPSYGTSRCPQKPSSLSRTPEKIWKISKPKWWDLCFSAETTIFGTKFHRWCEFGDRFWASKPILWDQ